MLIFPAIEGDGKICFDRLLTVLYEFHPVFGKLTHFHVKLPAIKHFGDDIFLFVVMFHTAN